MVRVKVWKIINRTASQVSPRHHSDAIGGPTVTLTGADYLRVTRSGNAYQLQYKLGNGSWQTAGSFTQNNFNPVQAGIAVFTPANVATTALVVAL